jgi:hypothetical protein
MRLRDWLRRRQRSTQAPPSSSGRSTSPYDDHGASTALHAALAMNALFPDTAQRAPPESSPAAPPYGPHHTPHDSSTSASTDHSTSHSHHSDPGSPSSYDTGSSPSYDTGSGGYDSGSSSSSFDSGSASSW